MNTDTASRVTLSHGAALLTGAALLLAGAGISYVAMKGAPPQPSATDSQVPAQASGHSSGHSSASTPARGPASVGANAAGSSATSALPDVEIKLDPEAVKRAGIVATPASSGPSASELRLPGVVAPNAYRQVTVTPLVSGRITAVPIELGQRVRKGQTLARVYSPELSEAHTRYVSAVAMLDAHDRELQRTRRLVEIGAASKQELERIHAEHAAQSAAAQSARAQLELLGVPASVLDKGGAEKPEAATLVPSPIDGVIIERNANVGLNVDSATKLFTVADLSTVWVLADVHERDLGSVRVGADAAITADAFAGQTRRGRISYIDPQVSPETRTSKARIELSNASGELRPGMYVDVLVTRAATATVSGSGSGSASASASGPTSAPATTIPRSSVQTVGSRTFVYLADAQTPGRFIEREVTLGQISDDRIQVTSGIRPGDLVVTTGSFLVRAERERLGRR